MLVKNCKIVLQEEILKGDVRVEKGVITKISDKIKPLNNEKVLDAKNRYLLPKLIDTNVRLLDDTINEANLQDLLTQAQKGGVEKFVLIDDFTPRIENVAHLQFLRSKIDHKCTKSDKITLSINAINVENRLNNIATFIDSGAKAIYTRSDIEGNYLVRIMQYADLKKVPVFCFCENASIKDNGAMNEGEVSFRLGLPGIQKIAQISEVSKMVEFATQFNVKILFQSISTSKSIRILKAVKKDYKDVFTEVSIHTLLLNETACDEFNTNAKLISPLREESERNAMIESLKNGDIDVITSEHSPKSYVYKDVAFEEAKEGIDSLSLTLRLGYTHLVKNRIISFSDFMKAVSLNPSKIIGEEIGIGIGKKAHLILFDENHKEKILDDSSLYCGREIYGRIYDIKVDEDD